MRILNGIRVDFMDNVTSEDRHKVYNIFLGNHTYRILKDVIRENIGYLFE